MTRPDLIRIPKNKGPRRRFDEIAGMPAPSRCFCICGAKGELICATCRDKQKKRLAALEAANLECELRQLGDATR